MLYKRGWQVRRRIVDALIGVASLGVLAGIVLMIDARSGDQMGRFVQKSVSTNGGMMAQFSADMTELGRSAYDLSHVYGPLMTFGAVAAVLLFAMARGK